MIGRLMLTSLIISYFFAKSVCPCMRRIIYAIKSNDITGFHYQPVTTYVTACGWRRERCICWGSAITYPGATSLHFPYTMVIYVHIKTWKHTRSATASRFWLHTYLLFGFVFFECMTGTQTIQVLVLYLITYYSTYLPLRSLSPSPYIPNGFRSEEENSTRAS